VPVANQSDREATITSDGQTITVTMAVGLLVRVEGTNSSGNVPVGSFVCPTEPGAPHIAVCSVNGPVTGPKALRVTAMNVMGIELSVGCTRVVLPFPTDPFPRPLQIADVAPAVAPAAALEAIWVQHAAAGTWTAYSPLPDAPSERSTVNPRDTVWVCVRAAATLVM
jgi:hypothetical protein